MTAKRPFSVAPHWHNVAAFLMAVGLLIALGLGGCHKSDVNLSDKPAESSQPYENAPADSWVYLDANIPLAQLAEFVNAAVPPSFSGNGQTPEACKFGKISCVHANYEYGATRGQAVIGPAPQHEDAILVQVPIAMTANAKLSGTIAQVLSLKKSVSAAAELRITLGLRLDGNGCPVLDFAADHNWTHHPQLEIAHNVNVDIDDIANKIFNGFQADVRQKLQAQLSCVKFKQLVATYWKPYTFPVQVAPQQPTITVVVTPTQLAVDVMEVTDDNLHILALAKAKTLATTTPDSSYPVSAPDVTSLSKVRRPGNSAMHIVLPVTVGYPEVTTALRSYVVGKTFSTSIAGQSASVEVLDGTIYPSGGSLAVGLKIKASLPGKLLDTSGWVYLTGQPVVAADGNTLVLDKVTFARQLDNDLVIAGSFVFQDLIRAKVQEALTKALNLPQRKDHALQALSDTVAAKAKGNGYALELANPKVRLNRVVVANSLVVEPQVDTDLVIHTDLKALYTSMQTKH